MRRLRISTLEVLAVAGPPLEDSGRPLQGQVKPIHVYPEHGLGNDRPPARSHDPELVERLYLRIGAGTAEGLYGPIDPQAAWPLLDLMAEFLIGHDPLAGTVAWDKLARLDRHGRHGYLKMAISAVDNALWDLRGKAFEAPVYQLLGGPSRSRVPAYVSTLGASHERTAVEELAASLQEEGYAGQKWFLAHGPADGPAGMERNLELAGLLRAVLGPSARLMFDVFNGWDLAYARQWARAVEHLQPSWLEEPVPPTQLPAFRELHRATALPLAAGEHLYERGEVLPYLEDGLLTVLQCDPEWCGGVTDLTRIVALAETFGVPVVPHGHGLHAALHVVASQSPASCPMVEYLFLHMPGRHQFEVRPPAPEGGAIELTSAPGFGIELDERRITTRRTLRAADLVP